MLKSNNNLIENNENKKEMEMEIEKFEIKQNEKLTKNIKEIQKNEPKSNSFPESEEIVFEMAEDSPIRQQEETQNEIFYDFDDSNTYFYLPPALNFKLKE